MAEIKIEKKKPIWPWLLALLVLALIIYFLFFRNTTIITNDTNTNRDTIVDRTEMQDDQYIDDNLGDVAAFVAFVNEDDGNMTLNHEYSQKALSKLIDATEEISSKINFDSKVDLDNARKLSDEISKNPQATDHADKIKGASDIVCNVLVKMQEAKFPDLKSEANKTKMASEAINVKELALNQKTKIKSFFDDAADLLNKMNR